MGNEFKIIWVLGKKICWNYRKGRCRFGHNCKFAHDSDLQKSKEQLNAELHVARSNSVVCQADGLNPRYLFKCFCEPYNLFVVVNDFQGITAT